MHTRRAFLVAPGKFEIRELDVAPGPGQVLIRIAACGLCNWEQNHWKGLLGSFPQSLGHEWAGTVAAVGDGVTSLQIGDAVTGLPDSLSGFSDYIVTAATRCFKVRPGVPLEHALGEPLKCVVTVLRGAAPEAGDIGVVIGCGPMGLWCLQGLRGRFLSALIAIDIASYKLELARRFGATHTINPRVEDAVARIAEISSGHMADFVIEGTGIPEVLDQAMTYLCARRGRLALMSAHERAAHTFDWRPVQNKGVTIMGTHPSFSTDEMDDMRRAVTLLNAGTFELDGVISHRFPLAQIQEAFETLEAKPVDYIKGIVIP